MSEIPFVKALGDEIERMARRRRARRRIVIGGLLFAVLATGVAAASGVFNTTERLATTAIACYDQPSLHGGATMLDTGTASPVETCRRVHRTDGPLVACSARDHVAVFPSGRRDLCERLGLDPLPREYTTARSRVTALEREVKALEADCVPPDQFARRVQALLDRSPGWESWSAKRRPDLDQGPCGYATGLNGDGSRSLVGGLDAESRRVIVTGDADPALERLLFEKGLGAEVQDASAERCYTRAGLEAMIRARLAGTGRRIAFATDAAGGSGGALGRRERAGCAIAAAVRPTSDGYGIRIDVHG